MSVENALAEAGRIASRPDLPHCTAEVSRLLAVIHQVHPGLFDSEELVPAAKAELARAAGADEVIIYTEQDFAAEVKRITAGKGVHVIYDSVGRSTFLAGFDVLERRGMMVLFGQSSGAVDPIDPQEVWKAAASIAAMVYVIADMPQTLPK